MHKKKKSNKTPLDSLFIISKPTATKIVIVTKTSGETQLKLRIREDLDNPKGIFLIKIIFLQKVKASFFWHWLTYTKPLGTFHINCTQKNPNCTVTLIDFAGDLHMCHLLGRQNFYVVLVRFTITRAFIWYLNFCCRCYKREARRIWVWCKRL